MAAFSRLTSQCLSLTSYSCKIYRFHYRLPFLMKKTINNYVSESKVKNVKPKYMGRLVGYENQGFNTNSGIFSNCWCHCRFQYFHTSATKYAVGPYLLLFLRPLSKFAAVIFGRGFRKWWKSLTPERKKKIVKRFWNNIHLIYFLQLGVWTTGLTLYLFYPSEDDDANTLFLQPAKRKKFILFSEEHMKEMAKIELEARYEECKDKIIPSSHPVYQRAAGVLHRILTCNQDIRKVRDMSWSLVVIHDPVPDAFVLPIGAVFISTGMMEECLNDDQLSIVMSHEVAHAILSHMAEQLSSVHVLEVILAVFLVFVWAVLPDIGAVLTHLLSEKILDLSCHLPFSRELEVEADMAGLMLSAKACFDPREAITFWRNMNDVALINNEKSLEWLSTHPSHETRLNLLQQSMVQALELRQKSDCPALLIPGLKSTASSCATADWNH